MATYKQTIAKGRYAALALGILCGLFAYARIATGYAGFIEFWAVVCFFGGIAGFFTDWQRVR